MADRNCFDRGGESCTVKLKHINPNPAFRLSEAVAVETPGTQFIFVSGQVGHGEQGIPEDLSEQAEIAFANVIKQLEAAGAGATGGGGAEEGGGRGAEEVGGLRALASRDLLAGQTSGLGQLAGPLAVSAGAAVDVVTLGRVARALDGTAPRAASDARRAALAATGSFETISAPASAAARVLARVVGTEATDRIDLLPDAPADWRGGQIDVRSCGTANGRLSFSVRWHGDRPALLWERRGGSDAIELRCPGLDPTWKSLEREGEALLAAPS